MMFYSDIAYDHCYIEWREQWSILYITNLISPSFGWFHQPVSPQFKEARPIQYQHNVIPFHFNHLN